MYNYVDAGCNNSRLLIAKREARLQYCTFTENVADLKSNESNILKYGTSKDLSEHALHNNFNIL
jgi:hypothetical protein